MTRKMKDSRIEWIGEIPEEWDVCNLGYNSKMIVPMRDKPTSFGGDIPWIRIEDFQGMYISQSKTNQNVTNELVQSMNLKIYPIGTVLCSCSCDLGRCAIVENELCSNQTFIGIVPNKNLNSMFLYFLMTSSSERLNFMSSGTIQSYLSRQNFEHIKIQLPPLHEQEKIADYLEQKCIKIDETIEKEKQVIEKLKTYKQSVITEAVTKGLNADVPMKDSGIEWIGEIPDSWEIGKVSYLFEVQLGKMLQPNQKQKTDSLEYYMCSANISWLGIKLDVIKQMWFSESEKPNYLLRKGDLIVTEGGDVGVACLWENEIENCYIQNAVHRVRTKGNSDVKYLYYWLTVLKAVGYIDLVCNKATIAHYTKEKFCNTLILTPSLLEQRKITEYLDDKCSKIDNTIIYKEKLIEKLTDYKKSLIYECVTGKREV